MKICGIGSAIVRCDADGYGVCILLVFGVLGRPSVFQCCRIQSIKARRTSTKTSQYRSASKTSVSMSSNSLTSRLLFRLSSLSCS